MTTLQIFAFLLWDIFPMLHKYFINAVKTWSDSINNIFSKCKPSNADKLHYNIGPVFL